MIKRIGLIIIFVTGACWLALAQEDTLEQSMKRGEEVYSNNCAACHMPEGEGVEIACPPLANTSYLENQQRAIGIILKGISGEITVNEKKYDLSMDSLNTLTDREIADVLNFVSNSWGNKYPMIIPEQVMEQRKKEM